MVGKLKKVDRDELLRLHRAYQVEEFRVKIGAILEAAERAGGCELGLAINRIKRAIKSVADEFEIELDLKTLEAGQEQIDKYRKPYLELLEKNDKLQRKELAKIFPKLRKVG